MDVEKTKKINELISTLKKHKTLSGITDAVKKAQEILQNEELPQEDVKGDSSQNRSFEKLELMIKESNKAVRSELDIIKKGLLSLNEEFEQLREEFYDFKNELADNQKHEKPAQTNEEPSQDEKEHEEGASRDSKEEAEESSENENPRSGEFNEKDVAIDKIFYYGNK